MSKNDRANYDYIIIGAGSAGCVLAHRLTEDPDVNVLVIEAGGPDHWWDFRIHMPAALVYPLQSKTYNWQFASEPEPALNGRVIPLFRGKVLGGSSTINGMVYIRGNPLDFDAWAKEQALAQWSYEHCLPYFRRSETYDQGEDEFRGGEGPLHVTKGLARSPLYQVFLEAAYEAGHAPIVDMNGYRQEGFGRMDMTVHNGVRESTARAYLRPAMRRRNLSVVTGALVSRIVVDKGVAKGVEFLSQNSVHKVGAEREVLLSAGAIQSPQLLMLSGIGEPGTLRSHGITPIHDLPGVGQNLQDHIEYIVAYECLKPVSYYEFTKLHQRAKIGMEWCATKTGLGASNFFEAGGFLRSTPDQLWPDVQLHFVGLAAEYSGRLSAPGHSFQVHLGPQKPKSRGTVTLRSSNPDDPPVIRPNYLAVEQDWIDSRNAIRASHDILQQHALRPYRGREIKPGVELSDTRRLDDFIRSNAESGYHYVGTCKMGSDAGAVVDGSLCVHGIQRLRVVDASVMPTITNGNTNAPTIMIAEKASDLIRGTSLPAAQASFYKASTK